MILHRYFAWRFLLSFLGVATVFFLIMLFVDLVDQLRRFGSSDATMGDLILLSLLNIPQAFYVILPLIMILSTIALFLSLARSSELVVTRAAGRSAIHALLGPAIVAGSVGLAAVAILNPIVAATSKQYEAQVDALRGDRSVLALGTSGLWLRQGGADGQTVIHANRANLDGTRLADVSFLTFAPDGAPFRRIDAASATLGQGAWQLQQAKLWPLATSITPEAAAQTYDRFIIPSTLTADQIRNSFGTPASIPIWDLPAFIARLQAAGFSAQRHLVWFHSELAMPLFLVAMMLVGASFTLRHQRGGRTGLMVMLAILLAFVIYFIRNFAQVLGENGQLPIVLAAWATPVAAIGIAMGILLHHEDG